MASQANETTTTTTAATASLPQILTRTALPTLIGNLDAGDVLECYAVTRMAPLHLLGNETSLLVEKSAIALRYPSPLGSNKASLELTLEYGPQRMGANLNQEAMPLLQQEEFVTWENEGKVYYTTTFETGDWTKANYVASLTGAVFELLLNRALEFAQEHARYQPVRVISAEENSNVWLKSSASHDFVYSVWEGLAMAGVELQPILTPPIHLLRLHASSIEKVSGTDPQGRAVSQEAYEFYEKLYQCATAIQTGNYQAWEPTAAPSISSAPTVSPSIRISESPTAETTESPTIAASEADDNDTDSPTESPKKKKTKHKATNGDNKNEEPRDDNDDDSARQLDGMEVVHDGSDAVDEELDPPETISPEDTTEYTENTTSVVPTLSPEEESGNEAVIAKEAAQHAKEAADKAKEAAQSPQDSKAADAAEEAADAAQAAADATSNAATKAAMEAFKSGDGNVVTAVLRDCFEDPRYGIVQSNTVFTNTRSDEETAADDDFIGNETVVTETYAYLYLDGSNYYRVNLTWPYLDVATLERPLPQPPFGWENGNVDAVDWVLALLVIFLLATTIMTLFIIMSRSKEPLLIIGKRNLVAHLL